MHEKYSKEGINKLLLQVSIPYKSKTKIIFIVKGN